MVIPGTLALMAIHQLGDFLRKLTRLRFQGRTVSVRMLKQPTLTHRMYFVERIEHGLLAVQLHCAGLHRLRAALSRRAWWSRPLLSLEHTYPIRGVVHRSAAAILVVTAILHLGVARFSRKLRTHWTEFPAARLRHPRDDGRCLMWRLGLRRQQPHYSPHGYIERPSIGRSSGAPP